MGKLLNIEKGKEAEIFKQMDNDGTTPDADDDPRCDGDMKLCATGGGDISWDEFLLFFSQRLNQF